MKNVWWIRGIYFQFKVWTHEINKMSLSCFDDNIYIYIYIYILKNIYDGLAVGY